MVIFSVYIIYTGSISHSIDVLAGYAIDRQTLYLALILPFIGLFLAFFRIIIGLNISNTFVPITIILTSFVLSPLITFELLFLSLFLGYIGKYFINLFRLHFAVKVSFVIGILSIALILILPFFRNDSFFNNSNSHLLILYGILIISLINERYLTFKPSRSNIISDLKNIFNTIFFSMLVFFLLGGQFVADSQNFYFPWLRQLIEAYPESVFMALALTIIIGRYTGLRLTEIYRFRKLIFKNH